MVLDVILFVACKAHDTSYQSPSPDQWRDPGDTKIGKEAYQAVSSLVSLETGNKFTLKSGKKRTLEIF